MSVEPAAAAANGTPAPDSPVPEIEVTGVRILPRTAAPTLEFEARIEDPAERPVYTIALTALILIEPAKRSYTDAERERLVELFGAPERWGGTTDNMRWAQAEVLVPSFTGTGSFAIPVAASYDLEIGSAKYFHGLSGGEVPLRFHFNGTIFYEGDDERLRLRQVPWDTTASFAMPHEVWRRMIADHYPGGGWIRLETETIDRLQTRRLRRGDLSVDATVADLLEWEESR